MTQFLQEEVEGYEFPTNTEIATFIVSATPYTLRVPSIWANSRIVVVVTGEIYIQAKNAVDAPLLDPAVHTTVDANFNIVWDPKACYPIYPSAPLLFRLLPHHHFLTFAQAESTPQFRRVSICRAG